MALAVVLASANGGRLPTRSWLGHAVILLLLINYLNLLPFFPFDGGHFVHHLFLRGTRWLQTAFAVLSGVAIAALALWWGDIALGFLSFVAFAAIPSTRRVQAVAREAERRGWIDASSDDVVLEIENLVACEFPEVREDLRPSLIRRVLSGLHVGRPHPAAVVLLLLVYLAPFALAAGAVAMTRHSRNARAGGAGFGTARPPAAGDSSAGDR